MVIYQRVGSREQEEGYSIEAQSRTGHELIRREGLQLAHEPFVEVHSARRAGRPVFERMIAYLRQNPQVGGIVAHKVDRLGRNLGDIAVLFEELQLRPWLVEQSFPDSPEGHLNLSIIAAFAKYFSENLRREILKGQEEKARQGGTGFRAPRLPAPGWSAGPRP
ncbi:MAG: recombinase family protein [Planctomycetota bacterium]|nr:MAG: recombinase family protein [Planctomycetota bacterium]